jgi:small-conductance mechanosensitive channel
MEEQIKSLLYNPTIGKLATLFIGIAIIWLIIKFIQKKLFTKIDDIDNRYKAKKFGTFVGYLLTIIFITVVYSNKLAIMFGDFYKTGDRVQLGGIKGDVMDIGVLRTTIMETGQWVDGDLYNGRIVLIANSYIFKEPVFNYSGDFPFLWDEIKVPIQYGSNYEKATQILNNVGREVAGDLTDESRKKWHALQKKYLLEESQTEPMVSLIANDNWVEFTLRYVVRYNKRRVTKTELFTKLLQQIEATNGEIKFASATFQIVETPDFNVNLKK